MEDLSFLQTIRQQIKTPFFSEEDVKLANEKLNFTAIHNSLSYCLKKNKIIKLRRGLYTLAPDLNQIKISKHELANTLYGPSDLSCESALSFYLFNKNAKRCSGLFLSSLNNCLS